VTAPGRPGQPVAPGAPGGPVLETERLILRRLTPDDAEFVLRLLTDPAFLRFIGDRGVRTVDDARAYIERGPGASYARHGFGVYAATLRDGTPVGNCGLLKRDALDDVDLGYSLLPEFRGRGYATEAAAALVEHARRDFGMRRLAAIVDPENVPSVRVLRAVGMTFERRIRLAEGEPELDLYGRDL
jgi:[ribosomal protein S5]-alanine N-acetyltransferase